MRAAARLEEPAFLLEVSVFHASVTAHQILRRRYRMQRDQCSETLVCRYEMSSIKIADYSNNILKSQTKISTKCELNLLKNKEQV